MKFGVHFLGGEHANRGRKQPVDRAAQIVRGNRIFDAERRYLGERVDSCVGPPATRHVHRFAFHPADNLLQNALDRRQPGLHLPTVKGPAIVGEQNPDAAHYAGREPGFTTGSPWLQSGHSSGR